MKLFVWRRSVPILKVVLTTYRRFIQEFVRRKKLF